MPLPDRLRAVVLRGRRSRGEPASQTGFTDAVADGLQARSDGDTAGITTPMTVAIPSTGFGNTSTAGADVSAAAAAAQPSVWGRQDTGRAVAAGATVTDLAVVAATRAPQLAMTSMEVEAPRSVSTPHPFTSTPAAFRSHLQPLCPPRPRADASLCRTSPPPYRALIGQPSPAPPSLTAGITGGAGLPAPPPPLAPQTPLALRPMVRPPPAAGVESEAAEASPALAPRRRRRRRLAQPGPLTPAAAATAASTGPPEAEPPALLPPSPLLPLPPPPPPQSPEQWAQLALRGLRGPRHLAASPVSPPAGPPGDGVAGAEYGRSRCADQPDSGGGGGGAARRKRRRIEVHDGVAAAAAEAAQATMAAAAATTASASAPAAAASVQAAATAAAAAGAGTGVTAACEGAPPTPSSLSSRGRHRHAALVGAGQPAAADGALPAAPLRRRSGRILLRQQGQVHGQGQGQGVTLGRQGRPAAEGQGTRRGKARRPGGVQAAAAGPRAAANAPLANTVTVTDTATASGASPRSKRARTEQPAERLVEADALTMSAAPPRPAAATVVVAAGEEALLAGSGPGVGAGQLDLSAGVSGGTLPAGPYAAAAGGRKGGAAAGGRSARSDAGSVAVAAGAAGAGHDAGDDDDGAGGGGGGSNTRARRKRDRRQRAAAVRGGSEPPAAVAAAAADHGGGSGAAAGDGGEEYGGGGAECGRGRDQYGGGDGDGSDPRVSTYTPPASPWGLVEEVLYDNPWRLLVACILLNRTTGRQVRRVLAPLWRAYPDAPAMAGAERPHLEALLRPLGLHRTRAATLVRFSSEFLTKQWRCPTQLHGCGRYAADAYWLFCRGAWRTVQPADKDLRRYRDWLASTGGEGSGLERERLEEVLWAGERGGPEGGAGLQVDVGPEG